MTKPDLVLLAYIFLIVPAMLVGFVFARRKMFEPYHKITMTTITLVNWALIILVMFVTYSRDVLPEVPKNITLPGILIPTIHLLPGLIAQLLATYLVIRMWFENQLPDWFKVKNIKVYMRTTLVLWLLTAVLGVVTWAVINKGLFAGAGPTVNVATAEAGVTVVRLVSGNKFDPAEISVAAGTTVQFVNADTKAHTVTADDGSFDSGSMKAGATFSFTFNNPGDVAYYCDFHGGKGHEGMAAIIHVTGSAVAGAATAAATTVPATQAAATTAATGAATTGAPAANVIVVAMTDDEFQSKEITIPVGATVRWENKGKHKHTATADDGSFDSGQLKTGESFEQRFDKAGDVPLFCANHGDKGGEGMSMIIHVSAAGASNTQAQAATSAATTAATAIPLAATTAATTGAPAANVIVVAMNDDEFQSKEITIPVGATVRWENKGKHKHTATADDGSFASGQLKTGESFEQRFDKAGDVPVYCENHGDKGGQGMSMIIHVSATATNVQAQAATQAATAASAANVVVVAMNDDEFQSKEITIPVGATVRWENKGKHKHTATADDGSFASGQLKTGESFEQRFDKAGDVPVYCENHGDKGGQGMSMVIHVSAAAPNVQAQAATAVATAAPTKVVASPNPTVVAAAAPLITSADDTPNKVGYVAGLKSQMAIIKAEAAVIDSALKQGHIEDAQAAAEAILNTIQGGKGTDKDADGKINQPGDGYGLQSYIFSINENAATVQGVATDAAQAAAADMAAMGRDALKALQTVTLQAQALVDAKTLVDARKADFSAVSTLDNHISMIADDAAVLGH